MAVPVARVHLKVAHAALPALLPTPPKCKMLPPLLPKPCVAAAILPAKPFAKKPSRADSDERWDAHKFTPASGTRMSTTSPPAPPKPGRADTAERWDAHKKTASPSSAVSRSSKWKVSRASSSERWDVSKKRCPAQAKLLDDGESSSNGSDDVDTEEEEEEIVWKPRAMYAGPGFAAAVPEPRMLPVPTALFVRVA